MPVAAVTGAMQGAAHRILVFDNCRNNPSGGWRQRAARDQAVFNAAELTAASVHGANALVLFSTAPGRVALDGPPGQNSPFAAALLKQLAGPTIDVTALPGRLRRDLLVATGGQQVLWSESTYSAPFVLAVPPGSAAAPASADPSRIVELPNAYAFAGGKNLPLPAGLVAIRPEAGTPHESRVGAYQTEFKLYLRPGDRYGLVTEALLVIVLSVDANGDAQVIFAFRDHFQSKSGMTWYFMQCQLVGNELKAPLDTPMFPVWMRWQDRNSGSCTTMAVVTQYQARFSRLDG